MPFDFQRYDNLAWAANEKNAARIRNIINQAIAEAAALAVSVGTLKDAPFRFSDYPQLNERVNKLFVKLAKNLQRNILIGNQTAFSVANKKADELINYIHARTGIPKRVLDLYDPQRTNALAAFQSRKENGLSLSDRVWKIAQQSRQEIEMSIDIGLGQGKSAAQLSRHVREHLNEPDRLFRRVRDKRGQLQLSKNALAFSPGQGVYRSSYKNAMRLTRTENNMAYREADFQRWNALSFVVGVQVSVSNNPKVCPICAQLQGKYPKGFKFVGWHPQCRCFAIPILMTDREFEKMSIAALNAEEVPEIRSRNAVQRIPTDARQWFRDNAGRIANYASLPYFIRDNPEHFAFKKSNKPKAFILDQSSKQSLIDAGFDVVGNVAGYNKLIKGFDLVEFDKAFTGLMRSEGIIDFYKRLNITSTKVEFIYDGGGVRLVRSFYKNNKGLKEVHHDFFRLPEGMQGTGISKSVFQELYKQYQKGKVRVLDVQANIDIGGYTWGKYGFVGKSRESIRGIIANANRKLSGGELDHFNDWLAAADKANFYPVADIANTTYGKKLLLGTNWYGYIDLADDAQRLVFENYLFKSK